jgi:hypothetical protein
MKPLNLALTLLSATLLSSALLSPNVAAQTMPAPPAPEAAPIPGPTYSQLYCAGFITRQAVPRDSFVLGSKESPHEDRFQGRSTLFLRGPNLAVGARYSLVRQIADPNPEDSSPEQRKKLASLGDQYQDVGWVTVHSVIDGTAVATFDYSCTATTQGDLVVPYKEPPQITFRTEEPEIAEFRAPATSLKGNILGAQDFAGLLGTGMTIYTDFGAIKGAKPGDYLLITRGYAPEDLNRIDRLSEALPRGVEDTAVNPAKIPPDSDRLMPDHVLGEILVLNVSPDSSTALITRASAEMELGDVVQAEDAGSDEAQRQDARHNPSPTAIRQDDAACQASNSFLHRALILVHLSHGCKSAAEVAPTH